MGSAATSPTGTLAHGQRSAAEIERVVSCTSAESFVPELQLPEPISKYESDAGDSETLSESPRPLHALFLSHA